MSYLSWPSCGLKCNVETQITISFLGANYITVVVEHRWNIVWTDAVFDIVIGKERMKSRKIQFDISSFLLKRVRMVCFSVVRLFGLWLDRHVRTGLQSGDLQSDIYEWDGRQPTGRNGEETTEHQCACRQVTVHGSTCVFTILDYQQNRIATAVEGKWLNWHLLMAPRNWLIGCVTLNLFPGYAMNKYESWWALNKHSDTINLTKGVIWYTFWTFTHHSAIKGISHLHGEVHLQGVHCYSEPSSFNICI